MKVPDLTAFVFVCPDCSWQVQGGQRARSDLGGGVALAQALALASAEHIRNDHAGRGSMAQGSDGKPMNYLVPSPLPRWWVDR